MAINWMVVKYPKPRFLPAWIRARLGEVYLRVDIYPQFVSDIDRARVFPSFQWASHYLFDRNGQVKADFVGAVLRPTTRAANIPQGLQDDGQSGAPGADPG